MYYSQWEIGKYSNETALALIKRGISPLVAVLLSARGIKSYEEAKETFFSGKDTMYDPYLLNGMREAVERIRTAKKCGEKIAVYGDYDVDGITATCILTDYFQKEGFYCRSYIPDRLLEGYGINYDALDELVTEGITLIITVDCGITAVEQTKYAKKHGIDMVITDHHECAEVLPDAVAVIDPKRSDCGYPFKGLAGVGVAFKLICALSEDSERMLDRYAELVGLGSIADVMPMLGENRVFVKRGLLSERRIRDKGLYYLMKEIGLCSKKLGSTNISYSLVPKLNAAGRMGKVYSALELLMTDSSCRAQELVFELCELNRERQQIGNQIYDEAMQQVALNRRGAVVAVGENWHNGVIGIVASRIAERTGMPTVIISTGDGVGKGSCRSVKGFNLFSALEYCSDLLIGFGGHKLATGFTIKKENIAEFKEKFCTYFYNNSEMVESQSLHIDLQIDDPELLTMGNVEDIDLLEPWGTDNELPVMSMANVHICDLQAIGDNKHMRLRIEKNGKVFDCVFFSTKVDDCALCVGDLADIAFTPSINVFRGVKKVQLVLCDIRPCEEVRNLRSKELEICRAIEEGRELTSEEKRMVFPQRKSFVALWNYLKKNPISIPEDGAEELLFKLSEKIPDMTTVKCYVCIKVFKELGLLKLDSNDGALHCCASTEKVDLGSSKLLKALLTEV